MQINDCVIVKTVESLNHWEPPAGKRQSCGDQFMCFFCCYCTGAAHQATVHEFLMSPMCVHVKERQPQGSVWSTPENRGSPWWKICIRPERPELPSSNKPEGKEMDHNSSSGFCQHGGVHPLRKLRPSPRNQTWKCITLWKLLNMQPVGSQPWSVREFGSWSQSVNWSQTTRWKLTMDYRQRWMESELIREINDKLQNADDASC